MGFLLGPLIGLFENIGNSVVSFFSAIVGFFQAGVGEFASSALTFGTTVFPHYLPEALISVMFFAISLVVVRVIVHLL